MSQTTTTLTEERALTLLGQGIAPETVAASLGVSAARISQLLSDENFAAQVASLRYESLARHNERDNKYDQMEDDLLERMKDCLPLMHRPMEILKAISVINAAKRRGASTPDSIMNKQEVISLTIPIQIINKFQTNMQGQVTTIESENTQHSLLTIQSSSLDSLLKAKKGNGAQSEHAIAQGVPAAC